MPAGSASRLRLHGHRRFTLKRSPRHEPPKDRPGSTGSSVSQFATSRGRAASPGDSSPVRSSGLGKPPAQAIPPLGPLSPSHSTPALGSRAGCDSHAPGPARRASSVLVAEFLPPIPGTLFAEEASGEPGRRNGASLMRRLPGARFIVGEEALTEFDVSTRLRGETQRKRRGRHGEFEAAAREIAVTVVSAISGEMLTTVRVRSSLPIASLKKEIELATGKLVSNQKLLIGPKDCGSDFETLASSLIGATEVDGAVSISLVVSQHPDGSSALPFEAVGPRNRDYLPASGLVSTALGGAFSTEGTCSTDVDSEP